MIRYNLTCDAGHAFDSWFASASAYDALDKAGQLSCAICGSGKVEKALMAPAIGAEPRPATAPKRLSEPQSPIERAMAELRRKIESSSDYVGVSFAAEARAMHDGTTPPRSIYGEARPDEARKLIEDGIQVMPLPFLPKRRSN